MFRDVIADRLPEICSSSWSSGLLFRASVRSAEDNEVVLSTHRTHQAEADSLHVIFRTYSTSHYLTALASLRTRSFLGLF